MKAIILTYAPVNKKEKELLTNTNIFKIATNFSAADLKPDLRLCSDNIVDKCLQSDTCPVVSINYDLEKERVINGCYLPKRHTTLVSCIDYLYLKGYTSILLIATNPDSATCKLNIEGINSLKDCLYLYKYKEECNLDIPYKSIGDFIMQTEEDKLLGIKDEPEKKLLKKIIFTDAYQFEVWTEGYNNKSVESGALIDNILPLEYKQKLLDGVEEINYNGTMIKRITGVKPVKEEVQKEVEEPKEEPKEEATPVKKTVRKKK